MEGYSEPGQQNIKTCRVHVVLKCSDKQDASAALRDFLTRPGEKQLLTSASTAVRLMPCTVIPQLFHGLMHTLTSQHMTLTAPMHGLIGLLTWLF